MNEGDSSAVIATTAPPISSPGLGLYALVALLGFGGGFLGILGSLVAEIQRGGGFIILPVIIAAPMIEEAMKPAGVYIALVRWPQALRSQLYTACLCALGGLVFGLVESWVYVNVYVDDPTESFIRFRYTVPVAMHVICSLIYGFGLNRGIIDWAAGRGRIPGSTRRSYISAVVIHGGYNLTVIILALADLLTFDD